MKTSDAFIYTSVILRILTKDDKNKMEDAVRLIKDSAKKRHLFTCIADSLNRNRFRS